MIEKLQDSFAFCNSKIINVEKANPIFVYILVENYIICN